MLDSSFALTPHSPIHWQILWSQLGTVDHPTTCPPSPQPPPWSKSPSYIKLIFLPPAFSTSLFFLSRSARLCLYLFWKLPLAFHLRIKDQVLRTTFRALCVLAPGYLPDLIFHFSLMISFTRNHTGLLAVPQRCQACTTGGLCSCCSLCLEHFPVDILMLL